MVGGDLCSRVLVHFYTLGLQVPPQKVFGPSEGVGICQRHGHRPRPQRAGASPAATSCASPRCASSGSCWADAPGSLGGVESGGCLAVSVHQEFPRKWCFFGGMDSSIYCRFLGLLWKVSSLVVSVPELALGWFMDTHGHPKSPLGAMIRHPQKGGPGMCPCFVFRTFIYLGGTSSRLH